MPFWRRGIYHGERGASSVDLTVDYGMGRKGGEWERNDSDGGYVFLRLLRFLRFAQFHVFFLLLRYPGMGVGFGGLGV